MAQLGELFASFTRLSKVLAAVLLGGFFLQLVAPWAKLYLALIPGRTLPFVYTIVTSGLLEEQLISALGFAAGTLFLLRIIEPVYGSREVLRFLLIVLAATGASTFVLLFALYLTTFQSTKGGSLLYTEVCGFHGAFAALLVAIKQVIPDNEVALLGGAFKFRAKHLAGVYVALMAVLGAASGHALKIVPFAFFGAYYGWAYLRFWQVTGEGMRGDPSDEFRFCTFFPEPLQPLVDQLGAPLARLVRPGSSAGAGATQLPGRGYTLGSSGAAASSSAAGVGSEGWEAARRRERGARALEERLGLKPGAASSQGALGAAAVAADVEAQADEQA